MALVVADRVQETSTTSGTGTLTLAGAIAGFQTFSTAIGNGNTTFYTIYDSTAYDWEVGIGTVGAGTLARTTVLSNSAGTTSPISFAGNSKFVFCTYPAEKSINYDANGVATIGEVLGYSDTGIIGSFASTVAGYNQVVVQNKSTATNASSNFNVSNDAGTSGANYAELGINSSTFTGTGSFNIAGASYVASASTDLTLGTYGAYNVHFVTNSSTTDAMTIYNNGGISLGTFGNPGIGNMAASKFVPGYTAVTSAAGTTVLTADSNYYQNLLGSTTQTYQLPDATTLLVGTTFIFDNDSSGVLTVVDNATGPIETVPGGASGFVYLADNGTVAGTWRRHAFLPASYDFNNTTANFGTATITNATWNGNTIGTAYGGTGLTSFGSANYALYSTSSSALVAGTLPIAAGGTGATTDSGARTNLGLGSMATQNANAVAITGGTATLSSVTTPSVTATTTDLTLSAISTGAVNLATAGGTQFKSIDATSSVNVWNVRGGDGSTTSPRFTTEGTGTNIAGQFNTKGTGALQFLSGNTEQMRISNTASAVNYVQVTGGATGSSPLISAQGSDSDIGLRLTSKGSFDVGFFSSNNTFRQFAVSGGQAAVNYFQVAGSVATRAPIFSALGSDTNISMAFQPKGTGAIDLAAGSSGVNISNGGTVTAITRTAAGSNYTAAPTLAITAPTTAGGVQATATCTIRAAAISIAGGGTGYTVGNTLTLVGGAGSVGTVTVATVSSGVITGITITSGGSYTTSIPSNPISVTGGSGTGATLSVLASDWGINPTFTITNAGSGYIEQPTVTFSGGGGSGATAFASVGGTPILASTSSNLSLSTANGVGFRIGDSGTANVNYLVAQGTSAGSGVLLSAGGADTNIQTRLSSRGTSSVALYTNNSSNLQFNAAHTASAVNYVQVTGSTTGSTVQVTAQGSDSVVGLQFVAKSASIIFVTRSGNARSFNILDSASPVNYLQVAGSLTGVAPILSAQGTDTNIDLSLTPKGTGVVKTTATFQAGLISGGTF